MTAASDTPTDRSSRPDGTPTAQQVEQDFTTPDADVSPAPIDHDTADADDDEAAEQ